jgi:glycosyltransferase involved in cell wall biosynthesis
MAAVLDRHSDAVLVVAGEGECLKEIERQARPLGDSVRFLGWQEDVGRLYAAADCVVITSHNEGMPVSLIEAAMAGVPGVTTDVGSAGEVILDGVTGLVVGTEPAEVADGLLRVLQADVRDQMGSAARRRAEIEFSSQRLIQDHQNLYRMLVAQGW